MLDKIRNFFRPKPKAKTEEVKKPNQEDLERLLAKVRGAIGDTGSKDPRKNILKEYYRLTRGIKKYEPGPGVVPESAKSDATYLATDSSIAEVCEYAANTCKCAGFPGYPFLAELAQYSEYRSPPETISQEMVRKWITLTTTDTNEKTSERLKIINEELERFKVRDLIEKVTEKDAFFGGAFLFIQLDYNGSEADYEETPLIVSKETIKPGMLKGFKVIEPMWVSPYEYNSTDPTRDDFYTPTSWYVLSRKIHASRMMHFVSHEVPDILKPAYNFGGLSTTQLTIHYVENWYRTRNAVTDMISNFSTSGIKTDLNGGLSAGRIDVENAMNRAALFNIGRDNQGTMLLNNDEEFFQYNVPLSGLDALLAQSQEQMSAPVHIPLVKLTGITPAGLNASSDGEIRVFYDHVTAKQSSKVFHHLKTIINIIQLNKFGDIWESIGFVFNPLKESTDTEKAQIQKINAEKDAVLVAGGIVDVSESRKVLADDPDSPYHGIDIDHIPTPPNMYETGGNYGEEPDQTESAY